MRGLVQRTYNATVRPFLPRKLAVLNGVVARQPKLLDSSDRQPKYEEACIESLREFVKDGDHVVVVGGGYGVSAVVASRTADDVDVTVFEAAAEQVECIEETLAINPGTDRIDVRNAVVAEAVNAWGDTAVAKLLTPYELPPADVMEIDAEGAEMAILKALDQRPRVLIVEAHEHLGCPPDIVREQMELLGYEIVSAEAEVEAKNVMVLTGVRE